MWSKCSHWAYSKNILKIFVIRRYFCSYFLSIFDPTSPHILYPAFLLHAYPCYVYYFMLSHSWTDDKNSIQLVWPDTERLVYWATNIPKQSCCGSSSPGSCTGTSSAATECSHHSKFRTSQTRSTSRSVSTARRLLVIDRFLATTAARSARQTVELSTRTTLRLL